MSQPAGQMEIENCDLSHQSVESLSNSKNGQNQQKIQVLETEIEDLSQEVTKLNKTITELRKSVRFHEKRAEKLEKKNKELEQEAELLGNKSHTVVQGDRKSNIAGALSIFTNRKNSNKKWDNFDNFEDGNNEPSQLGFFDTSKKGKESNDKTIPSFFGGKRSSGQVLFEKQSELEHHKRATRSRTPRSRTRGRSKRNTGNGQKNACEECQTNIRKKISLLKCWECGKCWHKGCLPKRKRHTKNGGPKKPVCGVKNFVCKECYNKQFSKTRLRQ